MNKLMVLQQYAQIYKANVEQKKLDVKKHTS